MAEPDGVEFPMVADRRSSAATGREAFARAAEAIDRPMARRMRAVKDWRDGYVRPTRDLVAVAGRRAQDARAASGAGLAYLHEKFVYLRDGVEYRLAQACELPGELGTRTYAGSGSDRPAAMAVPYRGSQFEGSDLRRLADRWIEAGVAEPSLAGAIGAAIDHPDWFDLRGTTVVVLGAGAELSPLRQLLSWGATVLAVELPRPDAWRRILAQVADTPGVLHVPVPLGSGVGDDAARVAEVAGVDLLRQLPDVSAWIDGFPGPLVLGNYLYADGALNVRLSMAADALGQDLLGRGRNVTLAFLATPTDAFQVGPEVVADARARYKRARLARMTRLPLRAANLFQPNYAESLADAQGREFGIADCIVPQQGPNYLLAKRLQRWRAVVARADGVRVSLNVAPATRTRSVVKSRLLAAAYAGAGRFGMEIFDPATTNALMAALLVRDLNDAASAADPDVPLDHPAQLFSEAATHGGLWRSAYSPRSVLGVAAVVGMIERSA